MSAYLSQPHTDTRFEEIVVPVSEAIREFKPQTVAGLVVKAKHLRYFSGGADREPRSDQDWHIVLVNELVDDILHLAMAGDPAPAIAESMTRDASLFLPGSGSTTSAQGTRR